MKNIEKNTFVTLIFVISFLIILILSIIYAQYYSQKNIKSVLATTNNAKTTFEVNNRLQELIYNLESIEIYAKSKYANKQSINENALRDTFLIVEKHTASLQNLSQFQDSLFINNFLNLVNKKKKLLNDFFVSQKSYFLVEKETLEQKLGYALNDSIYVDALILQKKLEENLKLTFKKNNELSKKILDANTILSIIVILSIAILGTLIIYRLLKQLHLIRNLNQEKERANQSAKIKEQFLANMSHEIRTPINAVVGFTQLLKKSNLNEQQNQFVSLIGDSGNSLLNIVNDILDFSKLDAGKMLLHNTSFSLKDVAEKTILLFTPNANEKLIELTLKYDAAIPKLIIGDKERLNQVLNNLCNNAIKFTNKGKVEICITLIKKLEENCSIQISIKDTGIGIAANKIDAIFERFEQSDTNTTREFGGTGLGLSIVKKIVELQNGTIKVVSNLGQGSTFIILQTFGYENSIIKNIVLENAVKEYRNLNNYKILVAEDNKINQILIKHILGERKINFEIVENGQLALVALQKTTFDLLLLDIQMPVLDGYNTAIQIRKTLKSDLPIIAMTANVLDGEKQKCLDYGMDDYISKPIDISLLYELINKYLLPNNEALLTTAYIENVIDYNYIDKEYLLKRFTNNVDFIKEITAAVKNSFPQELITLKIAIENKNQHEVMELSHFMVSTVTALSTNNNFKNLLVTIENDAKNNEWDSVRLTFDALQLLENNFLSEVNNFLNEL